MMPLIITINILIELGRELEVSLEHNLSLHSIIRNSFKVPDFSIFEINHPIQNPSPGAWSTTTADCGERT